MVASYDRRKVSSTGSPADAIGQSFRETVMGLAEAVKRELSKEGDFISLSIDPPYKPGFQAAARVDFKVESSYGGGKSQGWIVVVHELRPGDRYPEISAAFNFAGKQETVLRMGTDWTDPPKAHLKYAKHIVNEFFRLSM